MSATEVDQLRARVRDLCYLVRKVHKAKGRYHTQLAMCDLFDAVGLKNVRPEEPANRYTNADCEKSEARWMSSDPAVAAHIHGIPVVQGPPAGFNGAVDALYQQAVELVLKQGYASTSLVQRHLKIGYNRADCILEAMEREGICTAFVPGEGRKLLPVVERKKPDDTEGGEV